MGKLIAKHDQIIVQAYEKDDERIGGIIIPDVGKEKSNLYKIIDVGPGKYNEFTNTRIPMDSKVGEIIVLPKAVVNFVTIDGEDYGTCREVEARAGYVEEEINEQ